MIYYRLARNSQDFLFFNFFFEWVKETKKSSSVNRIDFSYASAKVAIQRKRAYPFLLKKIGMLLFS